MGDRWEHVKCGEPAHWYVDRDGLYLCESHAMEYLRDTHAEVCGALDSEPVVIGESGELEKAS